jgi:hypothetical protein
MEPGPRLPAVSRQRQSQSEAGPSIFTAPPRAVKFSISASFIASTYMERVLQYSKEHGLQKQPSKNKNRLESARKRDRIQRRAPSPPVAPPTTPPHTSLPAPPTTPVTTFRNHFRSDAQSLNVTAPTLPLSAAQTNSHTNSNERIKSGIEEVKSFLENCSPSMVHHFDSFIRAGVKNGEYLKAIGRLCELNTQMLSSILGPNLSFIDSVLLQEYLLTWAKGGTQE